MSSVEAGLAKTDSVNVKLEEYTLVKEPIKIAESR
jgi:hypothetical protein